MKFMFASDIHGSAFYAKKVLEIFEKEKAERLILLGDILYHGPRNDLPRDYSPKEVILMLNSICDKILCVRGNCDTEVDQMVLDFPLLADYGFLCDGGVCMYLSHGHIFNPDNPPKCCRNSVLINGHTHVSAAEKCSFGYYINPGSAAVPKGGNPPSYMIYENKEFTIKDLNGSVIKQLIAEF